MLKDRFLEKSTYYYCGDDIYNYELSELFDGRNVKSCFECFTTLEIRKTMYYCELGDIDISLEDEDGKK